MLNFLHKVNFTKLLVHLLMKDLSMSITTLQEVKEKKSSKAIHEYVMGLGQEFLTRVGSFFCCFQNLFFIF